MIQGILKKHERQMQNHKANQVAYGNQQANPPTESQPNLSQSLDQIPYDYQQQVKRNSEQKYEMLKLPQSLKRHLKNSSNIGQRNQNESKMTEINANLMKWLMRQNECSICQTVKKEQKISLSNCQHTFCKSCLDAYFLYNIQSSKQIRCPDQGCDALFNENGAIFEGLTQGQKKKYLTQKKWRSTQRDPNKRLCPLQSCANGIVDLLANPPICNSCSNTFCIECELQTHYGSCQNKYQQMKIGLKRCPQCKQFTLKQNNNHITCKCGHQFCYTCGEKWNSNHYQCQGIGLNYFNLNAQSYKDGNKAPQNCCLRITLGVIMLIMLPVVLIAWICIYFIAITIGAIAGAIGFPIVLIYGMFSGNHIVPNSEVFCLLSIVIGFIGGIVVVSFFYCTTGCLILTIYMAILCNCLCCSN